MSRGVIVTVVVALVLGAYTALTLPPSRLVLAPSTDGTIAGNLHIHTTRSDGRSTPDEVAAIAARAGLKFIVFTDHGDGTRVPDSPVYRSGVLCLDGLEISTSGGHLVALDMAAAPYPLAGDPRDVLEDVHRLGGMGIAAHPDSPKAGLRWVDWTVPVDGVEWINPDTSWRVLSQQGWRGRLTIGEAVVHYPFRASETLAHLLTPLDETTANWMPLAAARKVVVLSGVDAHAKLASRSTESGDNRFTLPLPSYESLFLTLSTHVRPAAPLTGDPQRDAALVLKAIRAGHLYSSVDGLATPPSFEFSLTNAAGTFSEGEEAPVRGAGSLRIRSNAPRGFVTRIWKDAAVIAEGRSQELTVPVKEEAAIYRAEIRTADPAHPETWLLSNPVYVRSSTGETRPSVPSRTAAVSTMPVVDSRPTGGWHVEADADATGVMETENSGDHLRLLLRFAFPPTAGGKSAALVWGPPKEWPSALMAGYDRVRFTARAERPMRIFVQLRALDVEGRPRRRWQRSVFVDASAEAHTVYFDEFSPSGGTRPSRPPLREVNAILFAVDTLNTKPGSSGEVRLDGVSLER